VDIRHVIYQIRINFAKKLVATFVLHVQAAATADSSAKNRITQQGIETEHDDGRPAKPGEVPPARLCSAEQARLRQRPARARHEQTGLRQRRPV